ncbi:hypothetical protein ACVWYS_001416 [Arthrobacter sp. TE12231]|nr:hypothetical protein C9424_19770 [Arthrobacter sp. H-02-3]
MPRGHFVYLSAQNQSYSGTVTFRVTVDGAVVSTNTSGGGYGIASCSDCCVQLFFLPFGSTA